MVEITKVPIFIQEIFHFQLPNFSEWEKQIKQIVLVEDNKKIHDLSSTPKEQCNVMAQRTAWNSHQRYTSLKLLCDEIRNYLNTFVENAGYDVPEFIIGGCWINWYGKDNYALPHVHGDVVSVVVFIDVEETDAKFFFHADNNFVLVKKEETSTNFSNVKHVEVKNGTVIFFDGSLRHSVSQNTTEKKRITVAMNFVPSYKEKRNEY
tara:strand:+ start:91 stop:711 length:621 start_codon:yes stop_codon:yes gene_type:complete